LPEAEGAGASLCSSASNKKAKIDLLIRSWLFLKTKTTDSVGGSKSFALPIARRSVGRWASLQKTVFSIPFGS
jgi:hypothetical protein